MKYAFLGTLAALLVTMSVPEANAVVCARGVYRAGCAGPHGAVVAPRPHTAVCASGVYRAGCAGPNGGVVVTKPYPHHCYWHAGVRVCR